VNFKIIEFHRAGGLLRGAALRYAEAIRTGTGPVGALDGLLADAAIEYAKAVAKLQRSK
jgi:hypothetical protein